MKEISAAKRSIPEKIFTCISICTVILVFSFFMMRFSSDHYDLYSVLLLYVLQPLAFILLAYGVLTGIYFKNPAAAMLLALAAWYLVCCYADKCIFELKSSEQKVFLYFLISAAVTFPFAKYTEDFDSRKILDRILGVMVTVCSVFWWIAYAGVYHHRLYTVLGYDFGAEYTETGRLILKVLSMHQYRQGFIASAFAFIVLYLVVSHPAKPMIILAAFLEITYIPGVIMSGGRTDVFGFALGVLYIIILLIRRKKMKKPAAVVLTAGAVTAVGAASFEGMNLIYKYVTHSIRDVWYGMGTLTSRTDIWMALFKSYGDNPRALLFGYPWYHAMDIINEYIPLEDTIPHLHSSYLQTMAVTGIPGLVLMVGMILCVIVNGVRIFMADESSGVTFAEQLLFTVPLCMIAEGLMELVIFANVNECIFANGLFMLLSGYVVFTGEKLSKARRG